jgi:hypothetical protein
MDYTIAWGGDPEDVWLKTRGVASVRDLHAMVREAVADSRWRAGMNVLLDHGDCDWSQMPLQAIEERAHLLIDMADDVGYQRCAFVVGDASSYGVGRMLALLLDSQVKFVARAFMSIAEARAWLLAESTDDHEAHVLPADI